MSEPLSLKYLILVTRDFQGFQGYLFVDPAVAFTPDHLTKSCSVASIKKHQTIFSHFQPFASAAMITKMTESPSNLSTSSSGQLPEPTSSQPGPTCSSPTRGVVTSEKDSAPRSPTQESLYNKRARSRSTPYENNYSPGGSCCSSVSSDEGNENDPHAGVETKAKRVQANSRERKRMHNVNSAFDQLRELVPTYPSNRKLSKIDTLRLACTYIQDLVSVLHQTRTMQGLQGEELTQFPVYGDSYMSGPYSSCFNIKSEATMSDFPAAFSNYRMPSSCITPVSFLNNSARVLCS